MGLLVSSLQKKKTHGTALEELEKKINRLEIQRENYYIRHKSILEQFLTSSVATYIVCTLLFYNFFYPETLLHKVLSYVVVILSPALIATVKRAITWFYKLQMSRTDDHIEILEKEKIRILDSIIKTESYLEAKKYFDRYAPRHKKRLGFPLKLESSEKIVPKNIVVMKGYKNEKCDTKNACSSAFDPTGKSNSPNIEDPQKRDDFPGTLNNTELEMNSISLTQSHFKNELHKNLNLLVNTCSMEKVQEIRENLSKLPQRFVFDHLVDYLSADGPSSRYALICANCLRHNGMALKEDFPYISFRCCYCCRLNSAKKLRPPNITMEFQEEKNAGETEVLYSKCEEYQEVTESESKIVRNNVKCESI